MLMGRKKKLGITESKQYNLKKFRGDCNITIDANSIDSLTEKEEFMRHENIEMKGDSKFTPLEQQVITLKEKYKDAILLIECGYKYRFFGSDAEIASKELNIMAHMDHNFMSASIPSHRLYIHLKRLVARGYKVGVVKQTETTALKAAGSNRSSLFSRDLYALYSQSTLIGDELLPKVDTYQDEDDVNENINSNLLVIAEDKGCKSRFTYAVIAANVVNSEIVYDYFKDSSIHTKLLEIIDYIQPVEILICETVQSSVVDVIKSYSIKKNKKLRIELLSEVDFELASAHKLLLQILQKNEPVLKNIHSLHSSVIGCFGALLHFLSDFNLEHIVSVASIKTLGKLSEGNVCMKLGGSTLTNLEIFENNFDFSEKHSLFWALNNTFTKFGARLLRKWIVQPLLDVTIISERQSAIEFIMKNITIKESIKNALIKLPDLEKLLSSVYYKKCNPHTYWLLVTCLHRVQTALLNMCQHKELKLNPFVLKIVESAVIGLGKVSDFAANINEEVARESKKVGLFTSALQYPKVVAHEKEIGHVEELLDSMREDIAKILSLPAVNYLTVSGQEYLIEVKNAFKANVPLEWSVINSTKTVDRYRPPEVDKLFRKLLELREKFQFESHEMWLDVLSKFSENYHSYQKAVMMVASLDALYSLVSVANANNYCKPQILKKSGIIEITGGFHPVVSRLQLRHGQYVPNDTLLQCDNERVLVLTGPNMGGKSCYMKQVAIIVLMAHIGSFVPAKVARLSVFGGIFTRMGVTDDMYFGKSSFMVEVQEVADIIREADCKSLVLLDELGRGTSTYDGVSIAMATLEYFLNEVKCITVFATHYLHITELEAIYPEHLCNYHMSFIIDIDDESFQSQTVTFLYELVKGTASSSYGLNVAQLAGIPQPLLHRAFQKSVDAKNFYQLKRQRKDLFTRIICDTENLQSFIKECKNLLQN